MTRKIRLLLIISITLNCFVFVFLFGKYIYYYNYDKMHPSIKVSYFQNKDEIFRTMPNDSNEIIFLGNSLTENFEVTEIFKDLRIKNRGIQGDLTIGSLKRIDEVIESRPLKIFIELGINDILTEIPIDTISQNYLLLVRTIKATCPNTKIFVQNILPTIRNTRFYHREPIPIIIQVNKRLENICKDENITYIDLYSHFMLNNKINLSYYYEDGLHLSGKGYEVWKNCIAAFVKD
jgi:lysophospholipase L1-like esterase